VYIFVHVVRPYPIHSCPSTFRRLIDVFGILILLQACDHHRGRQQSGRAHIRTSARAHASDATYLGRAQCSISFCLQPRSAVRTPRLDYTRTIQNRLVSFGTRIQVTGDILAGRASRLHRILFAATNRREYIQAELHQTHLWDAPRRRPQRLRTPERQKKWKLLFD
jgi:hypothetical protein